jgi:cytochrome c553
MKLSLVFALTLLPLVASAAERPEWAFGPETPAPRSSADPEAILTVPGSSRQYTAKEADDFFNPPDWFPDEHPPMPHVMAHGREPAVRACITCHVSNGHGHPDNSRLPGASAAYLLTQLMDFQSGARKGGNMGPIAKAMTADEMKVAADYFARLKVVAWTKVVETDAVPKTRFGRGNRLNVIPGAGTEPIGDRIIEVPEDTTRVDIHDPHAGFIAYVPFGEAWPKERNW